MKLTSKKDEREPLKAIALQLAGMAGAFAWVALIYWGWNILVTGAFQ